MFKKTMKNSPRPMKFLQLKKNTDMIDSLFPLISIPMQGRLPQPKSSGKQMTLDLMVTDRN